MVNLMLAVGGLWGTIINWFNSFIPSFGLTIIVFTIILKLILSPLEVYQKISTKKQSEMQAKLQPEMEKLQKKFGNNKEMLNQKTAELYKRENYNIMGSCLGMLINLVLTLVIFITLFSSLNQISQYNIKQEYASLQQTYIQTLSQELKNKGATGETVVELKENLKTIITIEEDYNQAVLDAESVAKVTTSNKYSEVKESFLWIKNIYRPDTWVSVFPSANEYLNISNTSFKSVSAEKPFTDLFGNIYTSADTAKNGFIEEYKQVTSDINTKYSGWNGYLILVILAGAVTVLSQKITNLTTKPKKQTDKKGNEIEIKQPNMKLMMFLLPALMIIFTIQYSSAFALYIVVNSFMSMLISFVSGLVINKIEKKKQAKEELRG